MISQNKILTVSYGTFSCTLEGFDESFETMKEIAEYFRDLAADDRYFGAEPPTPDAEMLARLAERDTTRRVEARIDQGNLVLSAEPEQVTEPTSGSVAAPISAPVVTAAPMASPAPEPMATAAPAPVVPPAPSPTQAPITTEAAHEIGHPVESAAERLARIRAVAHPNAPTSKVSPAPIDDGEDENLFTDDTHSDTLSELVAEEESNAPLSASEQRAAAAAFYETLDHGPEAIAEDIDEAETLIEPEPTVEAETSAEGAVDMESAIEVESTSEVTSDANIAEYTKAAEEVEITANEAEDAENAVVADIEGDDTSLNVDATSDAAPEQEAVEDHTEDNTAEAPVADDLTSRLADRRARVGAALAAELNTKEASEAAPDDEITAENVSSEAETNTPTSESGDHIATLLGDTEAEIISEHTTSEDTAEKEATESAVEANASPIRARVVKMPRDHFEAAVDSGAIEDATDEKDVSNTASDEASPEQNSASDLSDENVAENDTAEEKLRAELAKVEAELAQSAPKPTTEANGPANPGAERLRRAAPNTEENMGRLLNEADSQMKAPETRGRLNAIQQLRAAVAATRADQSITEKDDNENEDTEYRADLSDVVNQPRQGASSTRQESGTTARPAPLKLVAEQRVDASYDEPVRPRRVSDAQPIASQKGTETESSFIEFAQEMGATRLPELLEAAAAYLAFVEGREAFSRPQLMSTLNSAEPPNYSREDGLRCFGQLLRQGKIEKRGRGQFTVADTINYRPDSTRAAG